jgi:phage-related baseplate assembly protein
LAAIQSYLDRRSLVGTRLLVVGPQYLEVRVRAKLVLIPGAKSQRIIAAVSSALDLFLSPLLGGPTGRGWPFGRDVYRSEILEVIDRTPGVDHVEDLELVGAAGEPQCGNLCVGPLMLVAAGAHELSVVSDRGANGKTGR